ncbi:hypothetical protein LJK88_26455 [Paenibacillus sp. P26]|nr:hypothetical protein LJK88_26455 [Paenibacillus sp. P26]UUZ95070.1 hypothetical protein LJK87_11515 [Paenibacillus sp. P25]
MVKPDHFDAVWDSFMKDLEKLGFERLIGWGLARLFFLQRRVKHWSKRKGKLPGGVRSMTWAMSEYK